MTQAPAFSLVKFPVHLGRGATVTMQDEFTGDLAWYERYGERTAADGREGRLVSLHTFHAPWDSWEMHPAGDELVVCIGGHIELIQQQDDGAERRIVLEAGDAAINPPGVWHTADVAAESTALFITAGAGTEVRPR